MQIRIRHFLIAMTYLSVCCLVYTDRSVWLGTLVIAATTALLAYATGCAFNNRSQAMLVFSLGAWAWLVISLGFHAESRNPLSFDLGFVYDFFNFYRPPRLPDKFAAPEYLYSHSLCRINLPSAEMYPEVPSRTNVLRLAACLSSLLVGALFSLTFSVLSALLGPGRTD